MDKKVLIYTIPTCPFCTRAKQYMKDNNVQFEEVDLHEHEDRSQEMINKSGQIGVPVLDIEGTIVVGFDKDKIKEVLGI